MPCSLVVRSDRRLLRRLVQNLVSNAIKYTPSGRVLVGCRRRGDHLRIDVYDTGVGIPESKRRDIFVEFHRLEQGARIARGLGLGLSIVERVARVLGYAVELHSTVDAGSHFAIAVPRSNAAPVELPARDDTRIDPGQLAGTTALCIDNEPSVLDGMETLLHGWGCDVIKAPDLDLGAGGDRPKPGNAERPAGRLSPRPRQRHRGDRRAAGALRRPAGDPDHRRPLAGGARGRRTPKASRCFTKPIKPAPARRFLAAMAVLRVAAAGVSRDVFVPRCGGGMRAAVPHTQKRPPDYWMRSEGSGTE